MNDIQKVAFAAQGRAILAMSKALEHIMPVLENNAAITVMLQNGMANKQEGEASIELAGCANQAQYAILLRDICGDALQAHYQAQEAIAEADKLTKTDENGGES